jgi:hypothetical protein
MDKRGMLICVLAVSLLLISPVFAHREEILDHDSYDVYVGAIRGDDYAHRGDYYWLMVSFDNNLRGRPDFKLSAYIPELGIIEKKQIRDLKIGSYSEPLFVYIPEDARKGEYLVKIVLSTEGFKQVKYRHIRVV